MPRDGLPEGAKLAIERRKKAEKSPWSYAHELSIATLLRMRESKPRDFKNIIESRPNVVIPVDDSVVGPAKGDKPTTIVERPVIVPATAVKPDAEPVKYQVNDISISGFFKGGTLITSAFSELTSLSDYAGNELYERFIASPQSYFSRRQSVDLAPVISSERLIHPNFNIGWIVGTHLSMPTPQVKGVSGAIYIFAPPFFIGITRLNPSDTALRNIKLGAHASLLAGMGVNVASDIAGYGTSCSLHVINVDTGVIIDPALMIKDATVSPLAFQSERLLSAHFGAAEFTRVKNLVPTEVSPVRELLTSLGADFFYKLKLTKGA